MKKLVVFTIALIFSTCGFSATQQASAPSKKNNVKSHALKLKQRNANLAKQLAKRKSAQLKRANRNTQVKN